MSKNTEIIDMSSYIRKLYIVWFMVGFLFLIAIDYIFNIDKNKGLIFMILLFPSIYFLVDYFVTKNKIVLNLGNILVSKHKEYLLSNGLKTIDKLRISNALDYDEDQVNKRFIEFLDNNELYKYNKIYLTGSNSVDNIDYVYKIVNKNHKNVS